MLHRTLRATIGVVVTAAAIGVGAAPAAAHHGVLCLESTHRLDARLVELTFSTPALATATHVRVLLPRAYASSRRRYPVLYLLHGAIDDYRSWTEKGDAEQLTRGLPLIVVMPDSGPSGGYVNWYNGGAGGPPEWETYHVGQLVPWIDSHYRTVGTRGARAVAGLSMGGGGAMAYAARHPDVFGAAASFSGAVDTNNLLDIAVTPVTVYGPRATQEVRWRAHNPWDLAPNLRGLRLTIRTGDGSPGGPFGGGLLGGGTDVVEASVHAMSVSLHERLRRLAIAHVWDDYGPGGHSWPYWRRDLRQTLPTLMAAFARPIPPPSPFSFVAVEPTYGVYGWQVALRRRALEFSRLADASRAGFRLSGSGAAVVTTARLYRSRSRHRVTVSGARRATTTHVLRTDRGGRLRVRVALGPSNRYQQFSPQARAHGGTRVLTISVRIAVRGRTSTRAAAAAGAARVPAAR